MEAKLNPMKSFHYIMQKRALATATFSFVVAQSLCGTLADADWPQWRGPSRNGHSPDTGLMESWPDGGPKQLWIYKNAGKGYAGPAISQGALYTMGTQGEKSTLISLDANTGKERWTTEIGDILGNGWGDGPRGTPSVDGDRVYAMNGGGHLVCASTQDGSILWHKSMSEFGGKTPNWGYTESVVVDGDKILATPGGEKGTVIALNKATGALIWQSSDITDNAHYSTMVPASIQGQWQYVQRTEKSIFGIHAENGSVLWKTAFPGRTAVIPTPIVFGNRVYVTAGYGTGCKAIEINEKMEVKELYSNRLMKNHHGGAIQVGGHVFGYSDGVGWLCQDLESGEEVWSEKRALGKGAIGMADGKLICVDEGSGKVMLIDASTEGFKEHGSFTLDPQSEIRASRGKIWTHPVVINGKLYLRDQDLVYCYQVQ